MHTASSGGRSGRHPWQSCRQQKVAVNRIASALTNPIFLTTSLAAKRDLGVASQGEIHLCTSSTPDRSTGRFEAMPHSFVWLLKRVPLLNCHVDHDRPSLVCPSPRYQEFRPKIAFLSPFWRPGFSIDKVQPPPPGNGPLPLGCILLHDGA